MWVDPSVPAERGRLQQQVVKMVEVVCEGVLRNLLHIMLLFLSSLLAFVLPLCSPLVEASHQQADQRRQRLWKKRRLKTPAS